MHPFISWHGIIIKTTGLPLLKVIPASKPKYQILDSPCVKQEIEINKNNRLNILLLLVNYVLISC